MIYLVYDRLKLHAIRGRCRSVGDNIGFRTAKKSMLQGRNPNHKRKRQSQF
jgi:hypothetical protein